MRVLCSKFLVQLSSLLRRLNIIIPFCVSNVVNLKIWYLIEFRTAYLIPKSRGKEWFHYFRLFLKNK